MPLGFSDVLIGLQYGDEGKAKVIDLITKDYDIIARFNGGANAGHTIVTEKGPIALHQIPSGIFYPDKILYIGSGCVVNLQKTFKEIEEIEKLGVKLKNRLFISDQASIVQPHHILIDIYTTKEIGTTQNGIGPAYADKATRMENGRLTNIKIGDLLDDPNLFLQVKEKLTSTIKIYSVQNYDIEKTIKELKATLKALTPFVQRDTLYLQKLVEKGKAVLFEGANSVMLDVTKGSVPYVTSSNTVAGAAYVGGDLPPKFHRRTIGIAKAIMSRVGNGPFVSEFGGEKSERYCGQGLKYNKDYEKESYDSETLLRSDNDFEIGVALRILGNEYGSTTKRPRRIGALDLVQLSYAVRMNGVDVIFLNKCDLLNDFSKTKNKTIPVVTGYKLNNESIDYIPGSNISYRKVEPLLQQYPAFTENISTVKIYEKLPAELKKLLRTIEEKVHCRLLGIGTGPKREEYILFT